MTTAPAKDCHSGFSWTGHLLVVPPLLILASYLAFAYFDGRVRCMVAPYYVWMTPAAAVVLLAMVAACLGNPRGGSAEACHCHDSAPSKLGQVLCAMILLVPIGFGLLVNPRAFTMDGIRKREITTGSKNSRLSAAIAWVLGETSTKSDSGGSDIELPPNPTVLDVIEAADAAGPAGLEGRFVTLVGQCGLLAGPQSERFDLFRLVVTCCVADASSVSLEVRRPPDKQLESGSWVRVEGVLKYDGEFNSSLPVLHATKILPIPQPSDPYL
jgi:uncharacterized repeat protein (TIGR03943 family)